ncbi:MAG: tripartite tricarboxylate transporter TctB family protein [Roseobacter sp.]
MSNSQHSPAPHKDRIINTCAGLVFGALGGLVIRSSQQFEASGSVTPIFIGICLVLLSLVLILTAFLAPRALPDTQRPGGSLARRAIGMIVIGIWIALLPHLGFLLTSIPAFIALSFAVPTISTWTLRKFFWHTITAIMAVTTFWFILSNHLGIALPEAPFSFFN